MIKLHAAYIIVIVVLATSCTPDSPAKLEPVNSGAAAEQVATHEMEALSRTSDNGMLTVSPAIIDLCTVPEGIIAVDVSWDATSTGTDGTQVWLESPGEGRKLWSAAGAKLQARTGVWMRDGSKVILVGNAGAELAQIQISARTCSG